MRNVREVNNEEVEYFFLVKLECGHEKLVEDEPYDLCDNWQCGKEDRGEIS